MNWEIKGNGITLDIDTAIPIGLILNELVTNSFKYAHSNEKPGRLHVDLVQHSAEDLLLEIRDAGPGLPEGFAPAKATSLGLRLVRNLARQLYGSVGYRFEEGAVFAIAFFHFHWT